MYNDKQNIDTTMQERTKVEMLQSNDISHIFVRKIEMLSKFKQRKQNI